MIGLYVIQMGEENVKVAVSYRLKKKNIGWFDSAARDFIKVQKIEHDTLFLPGGKLRAVLLVTPINFDTLTDREIEAFNDAYSDFLDSLDYPIQLVVRSISLNLEKYFTELKKEVLKYKDQDVLEMFEDFVNDSTEFIETNATNNKLYLMVIPFQKKAMQKEHEALEALDIRVQTCRTMLLEAGIVTTRLETNQLISLLGGYFSRYAELNEDYLNLFSLYETAKKVKEGKN